MTKVWINNKLVENIATNFVMTNELNETLDSAIIKVQNSPKIKMKPYDDVLIEIDSGAARISFTNEQYFEDGVVLETELKENGADYETVTTVRYTSYTHFYDNAIINDKDTMDQIIRSILGLETTHELHGNLKVHMYVYEVADDYFYDEFTATLINNIALELESPRFVNKLYAQIIYENGKYSLRIDNNQVLYNLDNQRVDIHEMSLYPLNEYLTPNTFTYREKILKSSLTIGAEIENYPVLSNANNKIIINEKTYFIKKTIEGYEVTETTEPYNTFLTFINRSAVITGDYLINAIFVEKTANSPLLKTIRKRYLIDNWNEIYNKATKQYSYVINLMSETKGLEVIQLPNISLTQPIMKNKKKSVWEYLVLYLEQYNPQVRIAGLDNTWSYQPKYKLDPELESVFNNIYAPDFSLNNPNLRDLLSYLMITRDRIPMVENNVIKALDLSARGNAFNLDNITDIQRSMDSESYTQNLKKNYNNALSQDNSVRFIEKMGFRNSDDGLLTLENMRLETRYPIYKINKILMCYYKRIVVKKTAGDTGENAMMLIKQDITPLVLTNEERNLLSKDWNDFENVNPVSINELAQYRLATLGYDIGSKFIEGWGTSYTYPSGWWHTTEKTYIENILRVMDLHIAPLGINAFNIVRDAFNKGSIITPKSTTNYHENIISPFSDDSNEGALKFKGLFFEIDYNGFYNGTLIHSKDNDFGSITINDNPSSSLTILESDGVFQKEKLNRLGNEIVALAGKYTSLAQVQDIGSVYDDDVVIFKSEISVGNNEVKANYYGSKDYVMKNYFTSVFAKHRTSNLLSYSESVIRAENKKMFLVLDKDKYIHESEKAISFKNFTTIPEFEILSGLRPNERLTSKDDFKKPNQINKGFFYKDNAAYISDVNRFVSGNSMAFNIQMFDNVSGGVFIKEKEPAVVGSKQDWYLLVDDIETGFIENIGVYFCHLDIETEYETLPQAYNKAKIDDVYNDKLLKLPYENIIPNNQKNLIGGIYKVNKDNKEILDYTLQIEAVATSPDIIITPKLLELSDLIGNVNKVEQTYQVDDVEGGGFIDQAYVSSDDASYRGTIQLNIDPDDFDSLKVGDTANFVARWVNGVGIDFNGQYHVNKVYITGKEIKTVSTSEIKIECDIETWVGLLSSFGLPIWNSSPIHDTVDFTFKRLNTGTSSTNPLFYNQPDISGKYSFGLVISPIQVNLNLYHRISNGKFNGYTNPNADNADFIEVLYLLNEADRITTTYEKNLFIIERREKIQKHTITEEITDDDIDFDVDTGKKYYHNTALVISDVYQYEIHNGKPALKITLPPGNFETIELWYKSNGSYKLMLAVNITETDRNNGFVRIYLSLISNADKRVYDRNNNLVGEIKELNADEINNNLQKYRII